LFVSSGDEFQNGEMEVEVRICEILVSLVVEVLIGLPFVGINGNI